MYTMLHEFTNDTSNIITFPLIVFIKSDVTILSTCLINIHCYFSMKY